jgi:hypothetical protein
MKLSKMTKRWLASYLSFRIELTGKETKEELLQVAKIIGIPDDVSTSMYQKGCWRMECD